MEQQAAFSGGMWHGMCWGVLSSPFQSCRNISLGDLRDLLQRSCNLNLWDSLMMVLCKQAGGGWTLQDWCNKSPGLESSSGKPKAGAKDRCPDRWARSGKNLMFPTRRKDLVQIILVLFAQTLISLPWKIKGVPSSRAAAAAFPPRAHDNLADFDFHYAFQWIWDVIN